MIKNRSVSKKSMLQSLNELKQILNVDIIEFKRSISKSRQIEEYDKIYNNFIKTTKTEEQYYDLPVEGLYDIFLFIVKVIYNRYRLFTDRHDKYVDIEPDMVNIWILIDSMKQASIKHFIDSIDKLLINFFPLEIYKIERTLCKPDNNFVFPYILVMRDGTFSFDTITDLLVGNNDFIRVPISISLFFEKTLKPITKKPSDSPTELFYRDIKNMWLVSINCIYLDMSIIRNKYKHIATSLNKFSRYRKLLVLYIFTMLFKNYCVFDQHLTDWESFDYTSHINDYNSLKHLHNSIDIFRKADIMIPRIISIIKEEDLHYVLKYIIEVKKFEYDNNDIIEKCNEFIELQCFINLMRKNTAETNRFLVNEEDANKSYKIFEEMIRFRNLDKDVLTMIPRYYLESYIEDVVYPSVDIVIEEDFNTKIIECPLWDRLIEGLDLSVFN